MNKITTPIVSLADRKEMDKARRKSIKALAICFTILVVLVLMLPVLNAIVGFNPGNQ